MNEHDDSLAARVSDDVKAAAAKLHLPAGIESKVAARRATIHRQRRRRARIAAYALGCTLLAATVVWARQTRDNADPAPAAQPPTSTQDSTADSTAAATVVGTMDPGPIATTAVTEAMATEPSASSTVVSTDVSVNDPLPPQVDAATDPLVAEVAVRYAYRHWILVDLDKDLRGRIVENGEQHVALMDTNFHAARDTIGSAGIEVDSVTFIDADHAAVVFHVTYGGGRSPIFPDDMTGTTLFQNGTWRITSRSLCLLAFNVGEGCSGQYPDSPASPVALRLDPVPAGFEWQGSAAPRDVVATGGVATWTNSASGGQFTIATTAIAGVSTLSADDATDLLLHRLPVPEVPDMADRLTVAGRPGIGYQRGSTAALAYIRADDLIVSIDGQMSLEQLQTIAASLQASAEGPANSPAVNSSVPPATTG